MSAARVIGRQEAQSHAEQEEASHGRLREGRRLRAVGRWPFRERWANGRGRLWGSLTIPSLSLHLRRVAADIAMDLAGLLLDEEGTFSLTGFQDFMVRAQSACFQPLGVRTPRRSPPDQSGIGALFLALPWIGRLLRAMPTRKPLPLGPEGKASGFKRGNASD